MDNDLDILAGHSILREHGRFQLGTKVTATHQPGLCRAVPVSARPIRVQHVAVLTFGHDAGQLAHLASHTGPRTRGCGPTTCGSLSLGRPPCRGRSISPVDTSKLTGLEDEERPCSHQRCDGLLRQLTLAALTQPDRAPRPKRGPGHRCHVYLRVSRMEFTFLEPFSDVTHGIGRHTIYYANQCGKWSRGATRRSPLSWEVRSPCLRHRSHAQCGTRTECRPHQHPLRESGGGDHPNAQTWYLCDLARSET